MAVYVVCKRMVEYIFALFLIALLWPVMLVAALWVRWDSPGPALFYQERIGKACRSFKVYKFRTMTTQTHQNGRTLLDAERLTRAGAFLRKTSLDELPQLFNILNGTMSLIGPRPLPVRYLPYFTPTENRRHEVLPGITGWAQVNGRNTVAWEQRFAMDVTYVTQQSLAFDARIFWLTIGKVLRRSDVVVWDPSVLAALDEQRKENASQDGESQAG